MKSEAINLRHVLEMGFRFDPSLHLSEGVIVREILKDMPCKVTTLSSATESIFIGNIFSRIWVKDQEHGVPYLSASDTTLANLNTRQYLAKRQAAAMPHLILKKGWILTTCSGTLGNTTFTNANYEGRIATHDLIRIVPGIKKMPGGYIYAFLAGKYGYYQLTQSQFGGVVKHVNPSQVGQILIPQFPESFQIEIDGMIQEAARLREEADSALSSVHNFFESKIKNISKKTSDKSLRCSCVKIKDIQSSLGTRFEASYYTSLGSEYEELIKKHFNSEPLNYFYKEISRPDLFKRTYVSSSNGHMFIGSTELFYNIPKSNKFVSSATPKLESLILQEGWTVMPRSGTVSLGEVAYATSQHAQKLASEDVVRLKPDNILKGAYAYGFLSSNIGNALIRKSIFGSVIQHIEPPMLETIPVPVFDDEFECIAKSVIDANKRLGRAGQLELDAIAKVETEIEKWSKA